MAAKSDKKGYVPDLGEGFITLRERRGKPIYVRHGHIAYMLQWHADDKALKDERNSYTAVGFAAGNEINVLETPAEVVKKIRNA